MEPYIFLLACGGKLLTTDESSFQSVSFIPEDAASSLVEDTFIDVGLSLKDS